MKQCGANSAQLCLKYIYKKEVWPAKVARIKLRLFLSGKTWMLICRINHLYTTSQMIPAIECLSASVIATLRLHELSSIFIVSL